MKLPNWKSKDDQLIIGDVNVSDLFRNGGEFQTPLYLYDANIILDRIKRVKQGFPDFKLLYSIKSNPALAISALMRQAGLGAEIVSIGEFHLAQRLGFDLTKIAVTEPGKQADDLAQYIDAHVSMIHVESEREIQLVNKLSAERQVRTPVIVRINPLKAYAGTHENMSGPSKFGIPEEDVVDVIKRNQGKNVDFNGIHVYTGSQILDQTILLEKFRDTARIAKDVSKKLGIEIAHINFGGGFGVPYFDEQPLAMDILGNETTKFLNEEFIDLHKKPNFYLELGRYLVAESGIFLTQIVEVKYSRGTKFIITDSGINNFARPAMPWAMQHKCAIVSKVNRKPSGTYQVVGFLSQPSDILANEVELPEPEPGDIIAFFNAGVYGYTMSPQFYHSKAMPAEILYYQNKFHIIRKRLNDVDFQFTQSIPEGLSF
jgi:diaminopimelate decarboxylase